MDIKEIKVKSCITKSKITDYVINPYIGCEHGCKYCYADFIRKFRNIKKQWGDFVHVKINCPQLLKKELKNNKPGHIWMSSICDCYMPIESRYKLTRKILKIISSSPYKNKFTIEILTKSCLVKRDFDLLKKLNAVVGFSINSLDSKISRVIEPLACGAKNRIKVLKKAKQKGIIVFGFISPVLPGITNLEDLFKKLSFCNYVWIELLNTRSYILKRLIPVIRKNFPDKIKNFQDMINNPKKYHDEIFKKAKSLEKKYKLKIKDIIIH
jgi:DNA repair photolyase